MTQEQKIPRQRPWQQGEDIDPDLEITHTMNNRRERQRQRHEMTIDYTTLRRNNLINFIDQERKRQQPHVNIQGIEVSFPQQPTNIQITYMNKVIECLKGDQSNEFKGFNGLLQSPTGTGKTLALLCSILSWIYLQKQKQSGKPQKAPKLIYLSRTHDQLSQVIKQLKRTCFKPTMIHVSSRDHSCIKPQLVNMKGVQKIEACSQAKRRSIKYNRGQFENEEERVNLEQNMCKYYKGYGQTVDIGLSRYTNKVKSVKDMTSQGQNHSFCPYYYPFFMKNLVDVIFMPYNYILDANLLPSFGDTIKDSILVFDEAHNVPETACSGNSYDFSLINLKGAETELRTILYRYLTTNKRDQFEAFLKDLENSVRTVLNSVGFEYGANEQELLYSDDGNLIKVIKQEHTVTKIFELFNGLSNQQESQNNRRIAWTTMRNLISSKLDICDQIFTLLQHQSMLLEPKCLNMKRVVIFTRKAMNLLSRSIPREGSEYDWFKTELNHFRLCLKVKFNDKVEGKFENFTVELRCLVPWFTFKNIQDYSPRNMIFTSGTMSPMDVWEEELNLKFPKRLIEARHVIKSSNSHNNSLPVSQVSLNLIKYGTGTVDIRQQLNFRYNNMMLNHSLLYPQLVRILGIISGLVPNGVLVFCKNYQMVKQLSKEFDKPSNRALIQKDLIFDQAGSQTSLELFKQQSEQGAILFSACRGKASEGIDFPDGLCRAVIMVGIPYPNKADPILIERKKHYGTLAIERRSNDLLPKLSWDSWYQNTTIRAVNQSLGRVIRHKRDYGMLFLVDINYDQDPFLSKLPGWVKDDITRWHHWEKRRKDAVLEFFDENKKQFQNGQQRNQPNNQNRAVFQKLQQGMRKLQRKD